MADCALDIISALAFTLPKCSRIFLMLSSLAMGRLYTQPMAFFAAILGFSIFAGLVGSLVGIGGGNLIVPFLTLVMGVKLHYAAGASIVSVIATSSGAGAAYL